MDESAKLLTPNTILGEGGRVVHILHLTSPLTQHHSFLRTSTASFIQLFVHTHLSVLSASYTQHIYTAVTIILFLDKYSNCTW